MDCRGHGLYCGLYRVCLSQQDCGILRVIGVRAYMAVWGGIIAISNILDIASIYPLTPTTCNIQYTGELDYIRSISYSGGRGYDY